MGRRNVCPTDIPREASDGLIFRFELKRGNCNWDSREPCHQYAKITIWLWYEIDGVRRPQDAPRREKIGSLLGSSPGVFLGFFRFVHGSGEDERRFAGRFHTHETRSAVEAPGKRQSLRECSVPPGRRESGTRCPLAGERGRDDLVERPSPPQAMTRGGDLVAGTKSDFGGVDGPVVSARGAASCRRRQRLCARRSVLGVGLRRSPSRLGL